ncbi:RICIN domain-containing protein [Lentzea sp. NPDC102401]|uniref:RICIN domain-containing protein n=1 Tax=Lentzea sp. NPDC102401 TaxID=3364128 RepID=UPI0038052C41
MALGLLGAIAPAGAEPAPVLPEKVAPAQMGTMASAPFWLQNENSYKCALVRGGADSTPVVQNQCLSFNDQKWTYEHKGNLEYQIRNVNSGKCLLVRGGANGAPVVQYQCLDFIDQYWTFHYFAGITGEWYWLRNVNSGKCLLVQGNADGAQLVQFDCATFVDQSWRLWF